MTTGWAFWKAACHCDEGGFSRQMASPQAVDFIPRSRRLTMNIIMTIGGRALGH
jgi:hypothetical protein